MINQYNVFVIENQLLRAILFGGYSCNHDYIGYINEDKNHKISRSLLTHCIQKIFNIHRLPGYDEEYRNEFIDEKQRAYYRLTHKDLDEACKELEKLYKHTQDYLNKYEKTENGKLLLTRSLAYYERKQIMCQLEKDFSQITYRCNVVSSFREDGEIYMYGSPILLKTKVNIEDIAIFYRCLAYPSWICDEYNYCLDIEKEAWVVNNDEFGEVTYDIEDFEWKETGNFNSDNLATKLKREFRLDELFYMEEQIERYKKPCENKFINLLINLSNKRHR